MRNRLRISALAFLSIALCAAAADAQIGSPCLRPLGIPDKWIEMQTPPWDPTDTFDPTGPNPDVYYDGFAGFHPLEDQGRAMSLVLYDRVTPLQGRSAWPLAIGESTGFFDEIVACAGSLRLVGESFSSANGSVVAPFGPAFAELIAQDPDATWDPAANGGRGGVVNSAFAQSPRIIALPVFAPNAYGGSTTITPPMVKIVGFFVSGRVRTAEGWTIEGHLTGWSQITVPDVTARLDDFAPLSATVTGPGSPIFGLPVEFLYQDTVIARAETDGTGTARPATTAFQVTAWPGEYLGAIRVRLAEPSSFFVADESVADLTVLKKLPVITWLPPTDISYGTPLGAAHLNAFADVPGEFSYTPAAGTVLPVTVEPASLAATFVPSDSDLYDQASATAFIYVVPVPLTVTVNNVSKLYLDPLPAFSVTAVGFVNGEGPSVLTVSPTWMTSATASSDAGTYAIVPDWIEASNYAITLNPGVLTILPRPTMTTLTSSVNPSRGGQAVTFTAMVSAGASGGAAAGTVEFLRNGLVIGAVPVASGSAQLTIGTLPAGKHDIQARYVGTGNYLASVSPVVQQTVKGGKK